MAILEEYVDIALGRKNITHYRSLGYQGKIGEIIKINVKDVLPYSRVKITCICDKCGAQHVHMFSTYSVMINRNNGQYFCKACSYTPERFKKAQTTNMERYGTKCTLQVPEVKKKSEETKMERYGAIYTMWCPELKEKVENTNMAIYGCISPFGSSEVQEKISKTNMKNFGVSKALLSPIVRKKQAISFRKNGNVMCSKQQEYLHNLLGGILNDVVGLYFCDIVFHDKGYILEYDGGGHNYSVLCGHITQEEFDQRERKRFYSIKAEGFKQIRIISQHDLLPSDEIIKQIIEQSELYFTTTEHTWIKWDIDSGCFYNAMNLNGVGFDFGPLRKIKNSKIA